jgi:3-dehydroquinate synthase
MPVATGSGSYEILVGQGLLPDLSRILRQYAPAHRYALIADSNVESLYARDVLTALGGNPRCDLFSFSPGEHSKTRETWAALTDQMLQAGFGRDSVVVAIGGGVTGDLAGFVASTFLRGIPCVQVPTSLLAMIDSSIGGKTGVDTVHGKNLVGAFHQPNLVVVDGSTLVTLPDQHISAGAAEAIKHGAIADAGYLDWIVSNRDAILRHDVETLLGVVCRSIEIKSQIVSEDETEQGKRAILNFGHTVGHALEAAADFELLHGEAVAIGMLAESELGVRAGITERSVSATLHAAVEALMLPTRAPRGLSCESLMEVMEKDKKVRLGDIRFTLLKQIGRVSEGPAGEWTHRVRTDAIFEALSHIT